VLSTDCNQLGAQLTLPMRPEVRQPLTIVWNDQLREDAWFRFLLANFNLHEIRQKSLPEPRPNWLYVFSSNVQPLATLEPAFLHRVAETPNVGLFHASDEWFSQDYRTYRYFQYVIRTHHARAFERRGRILVVPLGWPNETRHLTQSRPASSRPLIWSFAGSSVRTRPDLRRAFSELMPHYCVTYRRPGRGEKRLTPSEYERLLRESVFCPAPMGNVMAETWRLYEALEAGSIPIVESHRRIRLLSGPLWLRAPYPDFPSLERGGIICG
jgi:hypothetical protein